MNCREFQGLIQSQLDGTPIEEPAFEEHRRSCADCAALHAAAMRLADGLRVLSPPAPPADLTDRIVARVSKLRRFRPRRAGTLGGRPRRRVAVPLAVAACLLIALGARLWMQQTTPVTGGPQGKDVVQKGPHPAEPAVDLRESVAEAGRAVVNLTSRTAGQAVGPTKSLLSSVSWKALADAGVPAPELPTQGLREAGAGVKAGLAPLTKTARGAVDQFLRELPAGLGDQGS